MRDMPTWVDARLGQLLVLNYGRSLPVKRRVTGEVPVYGSNGIVGYHNQPLVENPGIVVGRKGSGGSVHLSLTPFCPIDTTFYTTQADTPLDLRFLYYLLLHIDLKTLVTGVGVPGLNRDLAYQEKTRYPESRDEQRRIAYVLTLVQTAIEQQACLIALTRELKTALMQKLFTEGLQGEKQKQTEIGLVPEGWRIAPLSNIASIERGKFAHRPRNAPQFYGGTIPFVQTGDVSNSDGRIERYSQTLNEDGLRISRMFPAGTILITIAANIGFTGILQFDAACPDSLIALTPSDRMSAEFLQYYLSTQQAKMDMLAPRGTQKNINIQFLKPWPIPVPPTQEQREIAHYLGVVDAKRRLAVRRKALLEELFSALLHDLMTGQIRVNDLDLPGFS